ncbi:endonuclease NucS domain-containing protein [Frigoriflavimonas asaccharolytica]|uniref:Tetratricopeptide (TPR) repeat protein n=1 Tax=Frigoriflavimonas asaccharolytica TaxID=2735899 RepID=A0A8J8GCA9_9FLAO|nr:endonuclease NucS domain-containing protein [Frigoriflavimonas asaccharolytica]NRS93599.1 tetratricopeptide (TPR) repeat protein [Frigoriflavimonas asaccharolytica]
MIDKIIYLLEELKVNYNKDLLEKTLTCINEEITVNDLLEEKVKIREAINGQQEEFYNALAFEFVQDLNEFPEMYFMVWEPMLYFFNEYTNDVFFKTALEFAHDSNATSYLNGLLQLEKGNFRIALGYFNSIDHLVACYFTAICYLEEENYHNSIKQNEQLLKYLGSFTIPGNGINLLNYPGILTLQWNIHNDIGYAYNRINDLENALNCYKRSLDIFDLESNYEINHIHLIDDKVDEFTLFANNYLFSLEKTRDLQKCLNVLDFIISKYPLEFYYRKKRKNLQLQISTKSESEYVFNQIFKPKKPFNIVSFQSTKLISKEKNLEDMIVEQIKFGFKVFNKSLEIYQDENIFGRQYVIPEINGRLDLLLIDKENDQLYIIELKRNECGIEVVEQIEKYIEALSIHLNKKIKGIICLHKTNNELTELVKTNNSIELFTYNFEFTKED